MPVDWSNRHARLRFWLLCWAVIIFLAARHDFLRLSVDGGPVDIDPAIACFVLTLVYVYVLLQFLVQTTMEKRRIAQQIAKLERTLKHVDQLQKELSRLPRPEHGIEVDAPALAWSRSLDEAEVMPSQEAVSLMRRVRDELAEFDIAAVRLELATSDIGGRPDTEGEDADRARDVDRLKAAIRDVAVLNRAFEERAAALEGAVEASRAVLGQGRPAAAGPADAAPIDLARRLAVVETAIRRLGESLADDSAANARRQIFWVVYLPIFVSLLLVALSADYIASGAFSVLWRFVANLAALSPL